MQAQNIVVGKKPTIRLFYYDYWLFGWLGAADYQSGLLIITWWICVISIYRY